MDPLRPGAGGNWRVRILVGAHPLGTSPGDRGPTAWSPVRDAGCHQLGEMQISWTGQGGTNSELIPDNFCPPDARCGCRRNHNDKALKSRSGFSSVVGSAPQSIRRMRPSGNSGAERTQRGQVPSTFGPFGIGERSIVREISRQTRAPALVVCEPSPSPHFCSTEFPDTLISGKDMLNFLRRQGFQLVRVCGL